MSTRSLCFHRARASRYALAAAALVALLGCQKSPYELAPVRGKVTIGKQPLAGGKVMFAPVARQDSFEVGKPAFGLTQSDGSFSLTTYRGGDGAIVGEHWVTVFVPERTAPPAPQPDEPASDEPASDEPTYKRRAVRQKQVVVAGQENEINIAL